VDFLEGLPMKFLHFVSVTAALTALFALSATADTVVLTSGTTLTGQVTSYSGGNVTLVTSDGITMQIPAVRVATVNFGSTAPVAATAVIAAPAVVAVPAAVVAVAVPAPAPASPPVPISTTLQPGTVLLVSLDANVSSDQPAGSMFQTTLVQNVSVNGQTVVPAGAKAIGKLSESKQGGRIFGRAKTEMVLTSLIINGQSYALVTNGAQAAAKNGALGKTATNAAAGAAIGAAVNGGDGAGTGAAIGASASLLRRSQGVTTPAGTVLQFVLAAPTQI
jgi:hypothetical protein